MKDHLYFVYILASCPRGATYIGVTNNIESRVLEHKSGKAGRYAARWNITHPVYVEEFQYINDAIDYEKKLEKQRRQWKFDLIETNNPDWIDLYDAGLLQILSFRGLRSKISEGREAIAFFRVKRGMTGVGRMAEAK